MIILKINKSWIKKKRRIVMSNLPKLRADSDLGVNLAKYFKDKCPNQWQVEIKSQGNMMSSPFIISIGIEPSFSVKLKLKSFNNTLIIESFRVHKKELKQTYIYNGAIPMVKTPEGGEVVNLYVINAIFSHIYGFAA